MKSCTLPGSGAPRDVYMMLISVHGLIRGHELELGRDADTGGQTKYVVDLARALAEQPGIGRVDLLTRRVEDPRVSPDYAVPVEPISARANIVRIPCGPRRYLRKEVLWPYLSSFADGALHHIRQMRRVPDVIHAHYADAGWVGAQLAALLGVPLVYTGHSLGRVKRARLLEKGLAPETVEARYAISTRIEGEETALDAASVVIASTAQEVEEQYALYDRYQPGRMLVIPPGVDLTRFRPPRRGERDPAYLAALTPFLREPERPMILALSRADERKNIAGLVRAYGEHEGLRQRANLVVVAGNRDDIATLDRGPRGVLTKLLMLMDRFDLYGSLAIPKHHEADDVPEIYRIAAARRGVFVNPALTEPFGLTLLEAAASGLPVVATRDGGPRDILRYCNNGLLVDPTDTKALGAALHQALDDPKQWRSWARNGLRGAREHFSWSGHAEHYIEEVCRFIRRTPRLQSLRRTRLPTADRLLITDVDNTLLGDERALRELLERLARTEAPVGLGIATGRRVENAVALLKRARVPAPDLWITAVGTEIYYGTALTPDNGWARHIDFRWKPEALRKVLAEIPGLRPQPQEEQRRFKLSYFVEPERAPGLEEINQLLRRQDLQAKVVFSHQAYLDLLPVRASKGLAIRYVADKWGLPLDHLLVAGDSGSDEEMLSGNTLGVVVGNHSPELERLRGWPRIHFARRGYAGGILEGIEHYDFLGRIRFDDEEPAEQERQPRKEKG